MDRIVADNFLTGKDFWLPPGRISLTLLQADSYNGKTFIPPLI
jgi:hypothetical protein